MSRVSGVAVWVALAAATGVAQGLPKKEAVGTVTGHVMCADTQRPARLAQVKLVRVPGKDDVAHLTGMDKYNDSAPAGDAVETSLDGSYTIRSVKPGEYYLVVDKEGYLLPLGAFTVTELVAPDAGIAERMAATLRPIAVAANATVQQDVVLSRGASVSGTVFYDDGSPASGLRVKILSKDKGGKWQEVKIGRYREMMGFGRTDDFGHYRVTGLPAGEYATEVDLTLSDREVTYGPMPNNPNGQIAITTYRERFSLPLYTGSVMHKAEAKTYSLGSGEVRAGADLEFPLAKLHKVDGRLMAKDGHAINTGKVKLLYADDKSEMTEAAVQFDEAAFHLEFVPEGDFLLKLTGVQDATKVQVENAPGYTPRFHEESKTVKLYSDTEQDLKVIGDSSDVVVMMPDTKAPVSK